MEAIHPYVGEDTDEVSFEIGEKIDVIAFEDPDDQVYIKPNLVQSNIILWILQDLSL